MPRKPAAPICPKCGGVRVYEQRGHDPKRNREGQLFLRCRACYTTHARLHMREVNHYPKRRVNRTRYVVTWDLFRPAWAPIRVGQLRVGQYVLVRYGTVHPRAAQLAVILAVHPRVVCIRRYNRTGQFWWKAKRWVPKRQVLAIVGAVPGVPCIGNPVRPVTGS